MASVPQTEVHWHLWGRSRMGCCCESSGSTCSPVQLGLMLISPKPMPELAFSPPPMLASGANEAKASGLSKVELLRRVAPKAAPAPKRSCFCRWCLKAKWLHYGKKLTVAIEKLRIKLYLAGG